MPREIKNTRDDKKFKNNSADFQYFCGLQIPNSGNGL